MYRFLLTPRWWGINLFVALSIPVCLFMGSWQLSRFEDRVQDHKDAERQATTDTGAARPLASLLPVDKRTSGETASATGRWGRQLLVPDRDLDDKRGFYVLTLLDTDGGRSLPVVRGWLPGTADAKRAPAAPRGEVEVKGALQASESISSDGVTKAGGLPSGQVGMISAASLVNLVPDDVYDAWITLAEGDRSGAGLKPVPASAPEDSGLDMKAFQNLGYTGEWFVFAGFVLFMWFRLFRREREFARDAALGLLPDPDAAPEAPPAADDRDQATPGTTTAPTQS
ncbi:SURF1 family protein [Streptomyces sp. p1417]|uniref:SURF1-like protein n=1 Tax=Streptomyces typhae TaxID=2681492 RepID=A0A6L6WYH8_9ACTN|nr:SURF1 family protein [Streptomyces typhae]